MEGVLAWKAGRPEVARAAFAHSGRFTEALLVGNLATRLRRRIEWNDAEMRATNAAEAEPLIRKARRAGFGLAGELRCGSSAAWWTAPAR
jgi:hypothetical protein